MSINQIDDAYEEETNILRDTNFTNKNIRVTLD